MIRLGILGSTRGTNLQAIIEAIETKRLPARIDVVISNKEEAYILSRAKAHGIKHEFLSAKGISRDVYDQALSECLKANEVDLLVLIGYMRILSSEFVKEWENKVINIHPSLLPAHAGLMDLAVHQAVIEAGEKETGCTVHYVTEKVDDGPILVQKTCPVYLNDDPQVLKERVQALEGEALIEAIALIEGKRDQSKQTQPT